MYLTVKSILAKCDESFHICLIDDNSFAMLLPNWRINTSILSNPILDNMRQLALAKILHTYGGFLVPPSFLCMKNLIDLYDRGTQNGNRMFVCETVDRNITSSELNFYPNLSFYGAPKECQTMRELCNFIQRTISYDYTADTKFLGTFDKWVMQRVENGRINMIDGSEIGTKTSDGNQIVLDDLMSNYYLNLYDGTYGILIPANEILNRRKYEWFARMSEKQVLKSDTILGNYILVTLGEGGHHILEPLTPSINKEIKNNFVGFWRVPSSAPYYGLKPNFLGDNLIKEKYPNR
jgi:hypothetical protein